MKIQKCELLGEHLYFILDEGVKHYITHHIFLDLVSFVILAIKIFQMHLKGLLLKLGVFIVIVQLNNVDIVHGIHMDLVIMALMINMNTNVCFFLTFVLLRNVTMVNVGWLLSFIGVVKFEE